MAESAEAKETGRVEAFSDGVFAIAITLLVLELRPPEGDLLAGLLELWPGYLSFALSFVIILIMWVNHHGTFRYVRRVDARLLFANGALLLCVTFVPFPTAVLGAHLLSPDAPVAAAFYALTFVAINFVWGLFWMAIRQHRQAIAPGLHDAEVRRTDQALVMGFLAYAAAAALSAVSATASVGLVILVAGMYLVQAVRQHRPAPGAPGTRGP